jgi:hypothetical protein
MRAEGGLDMCLMSVVSLVIQSSPNSVPITPVQGLSLHGRVGHPSGKDVAQRRLGAIEGLCRLVQR